MSSDPLSPISKRSEILLRIPGWPDLQLGIENNTGYYMTPAGWKPIFDKEKYKKIMIERLLMNPEDDINFIFQSGSLHNTFIITRVSKRHRIPNFIGKVNNEEVLALGGGGGGGGGGGAGGEGGGGEGGGGSGGPRVSALRALASAGGRGNLEKPRGHSVGPRASAEVAKLDEFTLVKVSPGVWRIEGAPEDVFLTVPAGGREPILSPAARRYFSSSTSRSRKRTRKMRR